MCQGLELTGTAWKGILGCKRARLSLVPKCSLCWGHACSSLLLICNGMPNLFSPAITWLDVQTFNSSFTPLITLLYTIKVTLRHKTLPVTDSVSGLRLTPTSPQTHLRRPSIQQSPRSDNGYDHNTDASPTISCPRGLCGRFDRHFLCSLADSEANRWAGRRECCGPRTVRRDMSLGHLDAPVSSLPLAG